MAEQTPPPFNRADIVRCGTTEYMNKLKAEDPTLQGRLDEFEAKSQEWIKVNNDRDTVCFGVNKGPEIPYPYRGTERRFKLTTDINNVFCYKLIV